MTTLATHGAASFPAFEVTARDVMRALRSRLDRQVIAPRLVSISLHAATFAVSLAPTAALSWMFIAR